MNDKPALKLLGANGNAFNIMGLAKKAARKAGWPADKIDALLKDMMAGDYNHLLAVAMDNFDVN